jgi:hypothetical protein
MNFLGVKGDLHSRRSGRLGGRPSKPVLVQPAREVDASFLNESLAPVSRASSATTFEKKLDYSVPVRGAPS